MGQEAAALHFPLPFRPVNLYLRGKERTREIEGSVTIGGCTAGSIEKKNKRRRN